VVLSSNCLCSMGGGDSFKNCVASQSGRGNRVSRVPGLRMELPNWCEASSRLQVSQPMQHFSRFIQATQ